MHIRAGGNVQTGRISQETVYVGEAPYTALAWLFYFAGVCVTSLALSLIPPFITGLFLTPLAFFKLTRMSLNRETRVLATLIMSAAIGLVAFVLLLVATNAVLAVVLFWPLPVGFWIVSNQTK